LLAVTIICWTNRLDLIIAYDLLVLLMIKKIQPVVEKKIQPEVKVSSAKPQAASNA